MTAPAWPSVDVHKMFGPDTTPKGLPPEQLFEAFGRFLLESFIGNVALAFGGIEIAGWKPFDFLAEWGQDRIDEASANFILATQAKQGVVDTQDGVSQGAEGTEITDAGAAGAKTSIDGLRRATVANTTAIEKLAAAGGAIDDFNRTGSDLGSNWLAIPVGTGVGGLATDGRSAVWQASYPYGSLEVFARWQGAPLTVTASDYQKGTLVFSSPPGIGYPAGGGTHYGDNSILLRCDASPTLDSYLQASILKTGAWGIGAVVSNVLYPIASGTGPAPGAGSILEFYAGDKSKEGMVVGDGLRDFRLVLNGTDLLPWTTEATPHSVYGASYRGSGLHVQEQSTSFVLGTPVAIPGGVNLWTANDQV